MNVLGFQLTAIFSIAAVGALGAMVPGAITRYTSSTPSTGSVFSYANMCSSGVFLAAGLVHLLPDATDDLAGLDTPLPVASVLAGLGFILLLAIEQVTGHAQTEVASCKEATATPNASPSTSDHNPLSAPLGKGDALAAPTHSSYSMADETYALYEDAPVQSGSSSWVTAMVLWAALSAHSLLAGLALGADTAEAQWGVLVAILAHKGLAAFALCCSLLKANAQRCSLWSTLVSFVLTTPTGVVLGMGMSTILDGSDNFTGVVKALAAGTFVFVPAMELIPVELASPWGQKWIKLVALGLGYCGMSVLAIWC